MLSYFKKLQIKNIRLSYGNYIKRKFSDILKEKMAFTNNEPPLKTLNIRRVDIGRNYFMNIQPKRKKTLMILLESYLQNLSQIEEKEFEVALELFFKNEYQGKPIDISTNSHLCLSDDLYWYLYVLTTIDNMATQYARFDYLEYHSTIKELNLIPKEKRRKSKFVLTSHATNPNSIDQLKAISLIYKGVEQNDTNFTDYSMKKFISACKNRVFENLSSIEESITYHTLYLPNLIKGVSKLYDFGLRNLSDLIDTPSTWITYDFEQSNSIFTGQMTFTHGLNLAITIQEYIDLIDEAELNSDVNFSKIINLLKKVLDYSDIIMDLSNKVTYNKLTTKEFLDLIPINNLFIIENKIVKILTEIIIQNEKPISKQISDDECQQENMKTKLLSTSIKLKYLMEIFHLYGCVGQIRLQSSQFEDSHKVSENVKDLFKEISILNLNSNAADSLIIKNYYDLRQYINASNLNKKYQLNLKIIPLLEKSESTNDSPSDISLVTSSNTRQRDGLFLSELRILIEYLKNPDKILFMGQGVTAERGGGPFNLLHIKYAGLTKSQRNPHMRTLQGHFLASELASGDLAFTFLMNCVRTINKGDEFQPSKDYIEFLNELDKTIGVPQRDLWNSSAFNDFFVKNPTIKKLRESYNFSGSKEIIGPFSNIKKESAIVQAYINSDRCSCIHPELAFWNNLTEIQIKKMAKYYYQNNPHFKYIIFMYAYIVRRYDLEFAAANIFDKNDPIFKLFDSGKKALIKILDYLGVSSNSTSLEEIWNQHLGLLKDSSYEEAKQKEKAIKFILELQIYIVKQFNNSHDEEVKRNLEKKIKILQSALGNMSPFCGKG